MDIDPQLQRARDGAPQRGYISTAVAPDYPEPPSHIHAIPNQNPHQDPSGPASFSHSHSLGAEHTPATQSPDPNDGLGDAKRARACEPCRQLKVRCDPDPDHPDGSCKRCAKARRTCIVTAPTRKRQKKTDSRVAELERKIDALTATLQTSHATGSLFAGSGAGATTQRSPSLDDHPATSRRWLSGSGESTTLAGKKRGHSGETKEPAGGGLLGPRYSRPGSPSAEQIPSQPTAKQWRRPVDAAKQETVGEFVDMIDRGVIDLKTATSAFERYVHQMAPEFPFVMFTPGTGMAEVRRTKPFLFLAIMAIAVGTFNPEAQMTLLNEHYRSIAEEVVVKGHKTLELLQAILVGTIWYIPPDNFDEIKFYTTTQMAVAMAMELGMNRRLSVNKKGFNMIRDLIIKKPSGPAFDPEGPEARRTWVGCYYLSVQMAAALRRVHLVTWQPYMDECLEILDNHPDALPSDRTLKWWARLGNIMEDAGVHFSSDDVGSIVTFADSRAWHEIKAFENRLSRWRAEIPREVYTGPMAHTESVLSIFIHESVMSLDYNTVNNSPQDLPSTSVAAVIDALTSTIRSIHQSLDIITSIDIDRLVSLPTSSIARTSYPVVGLIKIFSLYMSPDSRLGQILDVQSLKVDYYLDKVIAQYRAGAARDGGRVLAKFGNILVLLRNWFVKKRDQGDHGRELKELFSAAHQPSQPRQQMAPGMTPLHFLSEVAMGDPANRPSTENSQRQVYPTDQSPERMQTPSSNSYPDPSLQAKRTTPPSTWPSYQPQVTLSATDPSLMSRPYYQPYSQAEQPQSYPDIQTTVTQGYPDMSVAGMQLAPPMGMAEVGVDAGFGDPFFTLNNMMDEGLFTFPLSFDGNFGFF
ncbi:uncharacterized protein N7511_007388 [Penicillium nucicola]|uniref:uncharacterized protein n=1 Tax=Penicillium nucicola TaxID=1850975 RepID=UPI002544F688|nr:uncharacterized protein N7511_007388 [Penicillium nucicola]KAJ5757206.1 hypothetical protein N7511_007388 [Penicillium nucicola]